MIKFSSFLLILSSHFSSVDDILEWSASEVHVRPESCNTAANAVADLKLHICHMLLQIFATYDAVVYAEMPLCPMLEMEDFTKRNASQNIVTIKITSDKFIWLWHLTNRNASGPFRDLVLSGDLDVLCMTIGSSAGSFSAVLHDQSYLFHYQC